MLGKLPDMSGGVSISDVLADRACVDLDLDRSIDDGWDQWSELTAQLADPTILASSLAFV